MKHTPGPWEVELVCGLPRVISDSRNSNCRCVADIHIDEGVGALQGKNKDGAFKNPELRDLIAANARLVAAAPELFNALRWSVNHEGECLGDYPEILDFAKSVIAKVEVQP